MFPAVLLGTICLVVWNPWMFGLSFALFVWGFFTLDKLFVSFPQYFKSDVTVSLEDSNAQQSDPLLHVFAEELQVSRPSTPSKLHVNQDDRCSSAGSDRRKLEVPEDAVFVSSGGKVLSRKPSSVLSADFASKGSNDLKIDNRLDQALSKFCTAFFDYYISAGWAPYETRNHLRLAIKSAFTSLGEKIRDRLSDEEEFYQFLEVHVLPLFLHYIRKIQLLQLPCDQSQPVNRTKVELQARLRLRSLCVQLLESKLTVEDMKCKLWFELALSVLSDGVFWNLFSLARNGIPRLFEHEAQLYKDRRSIPSTSNQYIAWALQLTCCGISFLSNCLDLLVTKVRVLSKRLVSRENRVKEREELTNAVIAEPTAAFPLTVSDVPEKIVSNNATQNVHLLLDSFLDPSNDLHQPDRIVSRWRPSLDVILVERELLYCLIQYLKGNKALEYLQAVLDDSQDGTTYCKKVLQLEYLPRFCRSKVYMESLGISQVDSALEAGSDSPSMKAKLAHSRSASFGGGNSGIQIWKIGDPKAVDGLPLHSRSVAPGYGGTAVEPDMIFGIRFGRHNSVEAILSKFMHQAMTYYPKTTNEEVAGEKPLPKLRIGTDIRNYDAFNSIDVQSGLLIGECDNYDCAVQIVTDLVVRHPGWRLVSGAWLRILRPVVKPFVDSLWKSQLKNLLTVENSIKVVDYATAAFTGATNSPELQTEPVNELNATVSPVNLRSSLITDLITRVLLDPLDIARIFKGSEDEILLFLVDLLDVLVNYLS